MHGMSNFEVMVKGMSRERFDLALALAMGVKEATHYDVIPAAAEGVESILFLHDASASIPLPAPLDAAGVAELAWRWLERAPYPTQPDIDGSISKGWMVRVGTRGMPYAILVMIQPIWAEHHK